MNAMWFLTRLLRLIRLQWKNQTYQFLSRCSGGHLYKRECTRLIHTGRIRPTGTNSSEISSSRALTINTIVFPWLERTDTRRIWSNKKNLFLPDEAKAQTRMTNELSESRLTGYYFSVRYQIFSNHHPVVENLILR